MEQLLEAGERLLDESRRLIARIDDATSGAGSLLHEAGPQTEPA